MKSEDTIEQEKIRIAERITPIYRVSENIKFNVISRIDNLIEQLAVLDSENDPNKAVEELRKFGWILTVEHIRLLKNRETRLQLHNYLINIFNSTMSVGIYGDTFTVDEIRLSSNGSYRNVSLRRLFSIAEMRNRVITNIRNDSLKPILEQLAPVLITENIVIDTDKTNALLQEAYQEIDPVLTEVLENEEIIRKNRRITEMDLKKLEAMYQYDRHTVTNGTTGLWYSVLGFMILTLLLLLGGYIVFYNTLGERFSDLRHTITYLSLLVIMIAMVFGVTKLENVPDIILPFGLSVITFALIFGSVPGLLFNSISLFLVLPFFRWNFIDIFTLYLAAQSLIIIMAKMKDPHDFLTLTIASILSFLLVGVGMSLLTNNVDYINVLFYGSLSSLISATGVILLSPNIEKRLKLTNKLILLQLQETNNPLLRRLAIEAPGTYNHSLMVGNMAESAAEAIGANALLAKVGGLYHDIGKLSEPGIFVENNSKAPEMHNNMDAYESTNRIRNHVSAGKSLAKQFKLPQQVMDIILQHHGDSTVSFFLQKAKAKDPNVDEKKYRYWGPKPRSKEASLVMIADRVESTAKVNYNEHTQDSLEELIESTIRKLVMEGQLSEAPITLKELEIAKNYMLPIIVGIHQKRIEYPKEKTDNQPENQ